MSCESNLTPKNITNTSQAMEIDSVGLFPTVQSEDKQVMSSCEPNDQKEADEVTGSEMSPRPKPTNILKDDPNADNPQKDVSPQQLLLPSGDQVFSSIPTEDSEKLGLVTCGETSTERPNASVGTIDDREKPINEELIVESPLVDEETKKNPMDMSVIDGNKKNPVERTMTSDILNVNTDRKNDSDSENAMICDQNEGSLIASPKVLELEEDDQKLTASEETLKEELVSDVESLPTISEISVILPQSKNDPLIVPQSSKVENVESTTICDPNIKGPLRSPQSREGKPTGINAQTKNDSLTLLQSDKVESSAISDENKNDALRSPQGVIVESTTISDTNRNDALRSPPKDTVESTAISDENKNDALRSSQMDTVESSAISDETKNDALRSSQGVIVESTTISEENKNDALRSLQKDAVESTAVSDKSKNDTLQSPQMDTVDSTMITDQNKNDSLTLLQSDQVESTGISDENKNYALRSSQMDTVESTVISDDNKNDALTSSQMDTVETTASSDENKNDGLRLPQVDTVESTTICDENKIDALGSLQMFKPVPVVESTGIGDENKNDAMDIVESTSIIDQNKNDALRSPQRVLVESTTISDTNKNDVMDIVESTEINDQNKNDAMDIVESTSIIDQNKTDTLQSVQGDIVESTTISDANKNDTMDIVESTEISEKNKNDAMDIVESTEISDKNKNDAMDIVESTVISDNKNDALKSPKRDAVELTAISDEIKNDSLKLSQSDQVEPTVISDENKNDSLQSQQKDSVESIAISDQNKNDSLQSQQKDSVESIAISDQNKNDALRSLQKDSVESITISDQNKNEPLRLQQKNSVESITFSDESKSDAVRSQQDSVESTAISDQNKNDAVRSPEMDKLAVALTTISDQNTNDALRSVQGDTVESTAISDQNKTDPLECSKTSKLQESDEKPMTLGVHEVDKTEPVGLLGVSPWKTSGSNIVQNVTGSQILMAQLLKGSDNPYIPGKMLVPVQDPSEQMKIAPSMMGLLTADTNKPETQSVDDFKDGEKDQQISNEKPETLPISDKNQKETYFVPSMTGLLGTDRPANKRLKVEKSEILNLQKGDEKLNATAPEPMEEDENDPGDDAIAQNTSDDPIMTELRKGDDHKHALTEKLSLPGLGLPKDDQNEQLPTVPSLTLGLFSGDAHKQSTQAENPIMAELRKSDQNKHLATEQPLTLGLLAGNESSETPVTLGLLQGDQNKQNEPALTLGLLTGEECNQLLSEQSITIGLLSNDKSKPLSTEPNSAMESSDCSPNRSELVPPVTCFEEDTRSSWNFDASKSTSLKELPRNIDENAQTSMHVPAKETLLAVKPMDEDSRISVGSQKSTKRRLSDDEGSLFPAERLFEYQWPAGKGEFYLLQEHVSEFLGVKSFKRKYPEFGRRPVDIDERRFLKDCGVVSETQCDLGLTAVRSDDVLELMSKDYPDRYQEYLQVLQERERQKISNKHKEYATALVDKTKINDFLKKAINSAAEYNAHLNQERREERKTSFDLQTYTVHIPAAKIKKLDKEATKVGSYPVALLTGQFQDSYRVYNTEEMKYLPMNTVLYGPLKELGSIYAQPSSDGSQSDSEDSCASGSCSSSQGTQDGSIDSSSSSEQPRPTKSRSDYVGDVPYKPKEKPNAQCKVCHSTSERNKEGRPEDLVHCSECESSGHPSCLELTAEMVAMVKSYPWQCMDCKTCMLCMDPYDEDKMMFCDKCDRGYHTFCVGLKAIPSGRWICQLCGQCVSCGSRTPGPEGSKVQWHQEISRSGTPNGEPVKQLYCASCAKQRKYR